MEGKAIRGQRQLSLAGSCSMQWGADSATSHHAAGQAYSSARTCIYAYRPCEGRPRFHVQLITSNSLILSAKTATGSGSCACGPC